MAKKKFFLILQFAIILNGQCNRINRNTDAYYWRDFRGKIPHDALRAGLSSDGKRSIHIGQTIHLNHIVVGKMTDDENTLYYEFYGVRSTTQHIQILCTKTPDSFIWIPTKFDQIHLLKDKHLVPVGHESNYTIYIGRVYYNSETSIGKVVNNRGLYVVTGTDKSNFHLFEILTYQPPHKL